MDEFEKVNETLENEETKTESETVEVSEDNEPVNTAEAEAEESAVESTEQTEQTQEDSESTDDESESTSSDEDSLESTQETDEYKNYPNVQVSEYSEEEIESFTETKKPRIIQRTIIIAASILLAALLAFGAFMLVKTITTPTLDGIWVMTKVYVKGNEKSAQKTKTSGKEATYYNFKSDGNFEYISGTVKQTLKWSYVDGNKKKTTEKTKKVTIYQTGAESNGQVYSIDLQGGLFAEKKLKIEASTNMGMGTSSVQVMEFKAYDGTEVPEYKMTPDKNFKPVDDLLGTWNDKLTKQKIVFNKDGSYVLDVGGNLVQTGNYKVDTKKKTVSLSYVSNGEESNTGDLPYKLKDNKLTLATYEFVKVK